MSDDLKAKSGEELLRRYASSHHYWIKTMCFDSRREAEEIEHELLRRLEAGEKAQTELKLAETTRESWRKEAEALEQEVEGLRAERDHHRQANEALRARNAELEDALRDAGALLDGAARDISATARANQMNLTGIDPVFPDDTPMPSLIGKHYVHQAGIDESLRVRDKCRKTAHSISALIDAAREKGGTE